jgi:MgsA AAA+ ATPase C terminal/SWIM zinc finger
MRKKNAKSKWTPNVQKLAEGIYTVVSETDPATRYRVELKDKTAKCDCPARGMLCKHQRAVLKFVNEEESLKAMQLETRLDDVGTPPLAQSTPTPDKPEKLLKLGYRFDEVTSAMQKEIRKGDEEAAVYWALILYSSAPQYVWKRVLVTAAEDIGLADPETVHRVNTLALGWKMAKESSWYLSPHNLVMSVILLCRAPKSTEVEDFQSYTLELIRRGVKRPMPDYAIDGHTKQGKEQKIPWSQWYKNRHDLFGIPVNRWTKKLAEIKPDWFEGIEDIFKKESSGS